MCVNVSECVCVPSHFRGQTSCEIMINDPKPGTAERVISITGAPANIQRAQTLMQNRFGTETLHEMICDGSSLYSPLAMFSIVSKHSAL